MTHRARSRVNWIGAVTLGVATGALMAGLALTGRLILRPLGSASLDRVVAVFAAHTDTGASRALTSPAAFADWRARAKGIAALSAYVPASVSIGGAPEPERLRGTAVATGFFDTTRTTMPLGRGFVDADHRAGADRVCVISDTLWRRRFGARDAVLGTTVHLDMDRMDASGAFTIVGVAPPGYDYPDRTDVWLPFMPPAPLAHAYSGQWVAVIGRLADGVSLAQAGAALTTIMQGVQAEHPGTQPRHVANLIPLRDVITARHRVLASALALTCVLLFLASAASTGLLLAAEALSRRREDAIRMSLGAPVRRLAADALRSGVILGTAAFALAVPTAMLLLRTIEAVSASLLADAMTVHLTRIDVLAGGATAVATASLMLLALKVLSLRRIARADLRTWSGGPISGVSTMRGRGTLVVAEIALAVIAMMLAAGAVTRVRAIHATNMGFLPDSLLTTRLELPPARYDDAAAAQYFGSALERLRRLPQVAGVAAATDEPLFGQSANPEFTLQFEDRPLAPDERVPILVNGVSRDYFALLGIPLVDGDAAPLETLELTAVVNETLARRLYGGQSPVGRRFRFGGSNPPWWTIVGVAADTRNDGPLMPPKPTIYANRIAYSKHGMTVFVRMQGDPAAGVPAVRSALAGLDPTVPIGAVTPAARTIERRFAHLTIASLSLEAVSGATLCLSALGLFGVLAALATALAPELALRAALGASRARIARLMWWRAGRLVLLGIGCGGAGGLAAMGAAAAYLDFGHPPAMHLLGAAAIVVAVALAATTLPVARAVRADPAEALRGQ